MTYNASTLNTPYSEGLTGETSAGGVISFKLSSNYGCQIALVAGRKLNNANIYVRGYANGTWDQWKLL